MQREAGEGGAGAGEKNNELALEKRRGSTRGWWKGGGEKTGQKRERERDMGSIIERKRDVECNVPAYDLSANFSDHPLIDCKHFASTPPL